MSSSPCHSKGWVDIRMILFVRKFCCERYCAHLRFFQTTSPTPKKNMGMNMKQQLNYDHNFISAFFRFLYLNGKSFWIIYLVQNLCLPVCTMMSLQPGEPYVSSSFSPQLVKRSRWAMRTCQLSGWAVKKTSETKHGRFLTAASNLKFLKTSEFQSQKLPFPFVWQLGCLHFQIVKNFRCVTNMWWYDNSPCWTASMVSKEMIGSHGAKSARFQHFSTGKAQVL